MYRKSYERECISGFMSTSDILKVLKIARAVDFRDTIFQSDFLMIGGKVSRRNVWSVGAGAEITPSLFFELFVFVSFNCGFTFLSVVYVAFNVFLFLFSFNPLSPSVKLQILLLCFHTFLTEVVGRSC